MSADNPEPGDVYSFCGGDPIDIIIDDTESLRVWQGGLIQNFNYRSMTHNKKMYKGNIKNNLVAFAKKVGEINDS